jgi:DNA polymerase III subunit epsilon
VPGIGRLRVSEVPIAVVDVETTGLHPNGDRIIEIAVIRVDPGSQPRIVLDTLVNPNRPVSATEIHGITDADVKDAPSFQDIASVVAVAMSGCVFASFNVYFDARFVGAELQRAAIPEFPPHLCLMYLMPGLDLGKRCTLADACIAQGVPHSHAHCAADDALASAYLWSAYLRKMAQLKIETFSDLSARLSYKFVQSFGDPFLNIVSIAAGMPRLKSRRMGRPVEQGFAGVSAKRPINPISEYWEALKACLSDLDVTASEVEYLAEKRRELDLNDAQIRSLHARAFAGVLSQLSDDHAIDDDEVSKIAGLAECLRTLGWTPGDRIRSEPRSIAPALAQRLSV